MINAFLRSSFLSLLLTLLSATLLSANPVIENLQITSDPIDTTIAYSGEFITFENGTPLPIEGKEGIYKLRFSVSDLGSLSTPTLYIGASPYRVRIDFDA